MLLRSMRSVGVVHQRQTGESNMECPKCRTAVTLKNFGINGKGDNFDIKFKCPDCKHTIKSNFDQYAFKSAEELAKGMLL